ncbi:MAG TPA: hypothetical protein VFG90_04640 [Nitrososphaeraceae archaeon]|nr:hypothetical protein [Nitrososphaeraceae archaeon]
MKVWIVTKEYWESSDIVKVYDSKAKAEEYAKKIFNDKKVNYEIEDLGDEITYYCPFNESSTDYVINEWDIE